LRFSRQNGKPFGLADPAASPVSDAFAHRRLWHKAIFFVSAASSTIAQFDNNSLFATAHIATPEWCPAWWL
jgi:hypothetical protein